MSPTQFGKDAIQQYLVKRMLHVLLPLFITNPAVVYSSFCARYSPKAMPEEQSNNTLLQQLAGEDKLSFKSSFINFEFAAGSQLESTDGLLSGFL